MRSDHTPCLCVQCGNPFPHRPSGANRFCGRPCQYEYDRLHRATPSIERFWAQVDKNGPTVRPELGPCWLWTGAVDQDGYGVITVEGHRTERTHRFSYKHAKGPIPRGQGVLHRCDVRRCIRPDHLWLGTNTDNHQDMCSKGRQLRGEQQPRSKLTEQDVREIRASAARGISQTVLAKQYGVWQTTISAIVRHKLWKHITP